MKKTLSKLIPTWLITNFISSACGDHTGHAMTPNNINIAKLYRKISKISSNSNYAILQNGKIVFYSPEIRKRLVNLSLGLQRPFTVPTMTLDPRSKLQNWAKSKFSWENNLVNCDNQPALLTEMDRLRLGPAWKEVLTFCGAYRDNPQHKKEQLTMCIILHVGSGHFLISNGYSDLTAHEKYSWKSNSAALYDANAKQIIKLYTLKQGRVGGASIMLSDREVLILGGEDSTSKDFTFAELLDLDSNESKLLPIKIATRKGISLCLDNEKNVYIVGGYGKSIIEPAFSDLLKVSVSNNTIENIGQLFEPRRYFITPDSFTVPNNTAIVNGELMVTGGNEYDRWNSEGFKYPQNIEFHRISKE
ncbi:MAG: hypothetical protein J0H83_11105 [Candidatus Melainabacteria bacterium]|nr:hypothetical protein [Candidatus Melainabacteria bacterium]